MRRVRTSPRGFTLIEALAAFAILVLMLSTLLVAMAGGLRATARAEFVRTATRDAQSHLAALGITTPISLGITEGRFADGLAWSQLAAPYRSPLATAANVESGLIRIDLTVIPGPTFRAGSGSFTLVAIKPQRSSP